MNLFFTQNLFDNKEETSRFLQHTCFIVDMFCCFSMILQTKLKSRCNLSKSGNRQAESTIYSQFSSTFLALKVCQKSMPNFFEVSESDNIYFPKSKP